MAGGASQEQDEIISNINVTPLVDIVLVLLIIMMVTANYIVSKTIPMELPEAKTGQSVDQAPLTISIDPAGKLYLNGQLTDEKTLRNRARSAVSAGGQARAIIAADGSTEHVKVVRVIDLLRQEKVTKFAINVRPEDLGR